MYQLIKRILKHLVNYYESVGEAENTLEGEVFSYEANESKFAAQSSSQEQHATVSFEINMLR